MRNIEYLSKSDQIALDYGIENLSKFEIDISKKQNYDIDIAKSIEDNEDLFGE